MMEKKIIMDEKISRTVYRLQSPIVKIEYFDAIKYVDPKLNSVFEKFPDWGAVKEALAQENLGEMEAGKRMSELPFRYCLDELKTEQNLIKIYHEAIKNPPSSYLQQYFSSSINGKLERFKIWRPENNLLNKVYVFFSEVNDVFNLIDESAKKEVLPGGIGL